MRCNNLFLGQQFPNLAAVSLNMPSVGRTQLLPLSAVTSLVEYFTLTPQDVAKTLEIATIEINAPGKHAANSQTFLPCAK